MKILDCHVHYSMPITPEEIISIMDESKTDFFNVVLVPDRKLVSSICDAMILKDKAKDRCYVFSSLDVSNYFIHRKTLGKSLVKYTKSLVKMGADGIKLIEGKPNMRKVLPLPNFDLDVWDPFWAYCEKIQFPILMHLNDPEEFWDINKIPVWAKSQGWHYDESFVNNEDQYSQMLNVLKKHPNLKIIFAHFFFMSKQLDRLSSILDTYPNVMIDLTPGIEMYINFQDDLEKSKEFFIKYQDRIIYGTDIGARAVLGNKIINKKECLDRVEIVRGFLSKENLHVVADGNFLVGMEDFDLKGINLDNKILEKIYSKNFINFVGPISPINYHLVIKECKRLKFVITMMSLFDKQVEKDFTFLNKAIIYFKNKRRENKL